MLPNYRSFWPCRWPLRGESPLLSCDICATCYPWDGLSITSSMILDPTCYELGLLSYISYNTCFSITNNRPRLSARGQYTTIQIVDLGAGTRPNFPWNASESSRSRTFPLTIKPIFRMRKGQKLLHQLSYSLTVHFTCWINVSDSQNVGSIREVCKWQICEH